MFSEFLCTMIAKSDIKNGELWLPVWIHAQDTSEVMKKLLRERYANLFSICEIDCNMLERIAIFSSLVHDIGKMTPLFQSKILESIPQLRTENSCYDVYVPRYHQFMDRSNDPHQFAGEAILLDQGVCKSIASVVGAHHGMPPDADVHPNILRYPFHYYETHEAKWKKVWREWIDYALKQTGFSSVTELPKLQQQVQVLLSGLLIVADWIASNQNLFPLIEISQLPNEEDYTASRCEMAWNKFDMPECWNSHTFSMTTEKFQERFSFYPNEVQKCVLDVVNNCVQPGVFIIEAPMGVGKTEAGLAAAEICANRDQKTGIFFGLPTQATANGIFPRIVDWAEQQSEEFYHTINLAHQNACFVPAFSNMQREIPDVENDSDTDSGLIVHSFFTGRKQACLADFVVATVDRMLMLALKKKHVMLIHLGLSQKVVLIDECHAYDAYMNQYLDRALEWLGGYRVPVILLSATLPVKRREELICAYLSGNNMEQNRTWNTNRAYPLITYTDNGTVCQKEIPYTSERRTVNMEFCTEENAMEYVKHSLQDGACIGIICNTVRKAQRIAEAVEQFSIGRVILYHAQFIMPDRVQIEQEIISKTGKVSQEYDRKSLVVVGTQVLEQSLDLDFDLLITDLCPMDLLLQRIGRLHRHKRSRPSGYEQAKCVIFSEEDEHTFDEASEAIYGKWLLMRTKQLIRAQIVIPDDIAPFVQDTYQEVVPDTPEEKEALQAYQKTIAEKKRNATAFLLGKLKLSARREQTLHPLLNGDVSESKAEASVRDGDSSVEVLLLVERQEGYLEFLDYRKSQKKFSIAFCPEEEDCRLIAQQRIRLPAALCKEWNVDHTISEIEKMDTKLAKWQKSHWLKGELVLILNHEQIATVGTYQLQYTEKYGLSYQQKKQEEA